MAAYCRLLLGRGVSASAFAVTSLSLSNCCKDSLTRNRRGTTICFRCGQPCSTASLYVNTWSHVGKRNGQIHISPTRVVNRDRQDAAQACFLDAWLPIASLVEPPPEGCPIGVWDRRLTLWAKFLGFGEFTDSPFAREEIGKARSVVRRRIHAANQAQSQEATARP